MLKTGLAVSIVALLSISSTANALSFGFQSITPNSAVNSAIGEAQLFMDVNPASGGRVSFLFTNLGPLASSITDVYFDDGTLLGITSINNGTGVNFSQLASPANLPGGNAVGFQTTAGFSADSNAPVSPNGVNPTEQLEIIFDLINGQTFADTIAALTSPTPSLRVGIHVQSFPNGGSVSFVNGSVVPEPSAAALAAIAIGFVGGRIRRRPTT